jgi:hypothetical protein
MPQAARTGAMGKDDGSRCRPHRGERHVGLVFLFSTESGALIAIIQDGLLQRFTVGAINAIGAKYLACEESSIVGPRSKRTDKPVLIIVTTFVSMVILCYQLGSIL